MKLRNNLRAQLYYRTIWVVIGLVSVFLSFIILNQNLNEKGQFLDYISPFLYYTNWSVYLAFIVAVTSLVSTCIQLAHKEKEGNNEFVPMLKFCADIMIIATFIVAGFVLPDKIWTAAYWTSVPSIFKHFLMPIVTVVDSVLFDKKRSYRFVYAFFGVGFPLIYWIVIVTRFCMVRSSYGESGIPQELQSHYYPYGFTNLDNGHSLGGLIGLLAGICVGLIAIGLLFYVLNHLTRDEEEDKWKILKGVEEKEMHDVIHAILVKRASEPKKTENNNDD